MSSGNEGLSLGFGPETSGRSLLVGRVLAAWDLPALWVEVVPWKAWQQQLLFPECKGAAFSVRARIWGVRPCVWDVWCWREHPFV